MHIMGGAGGHERSKSAVLGDAVDGNVVTKFLRGGQSGVVGGSGILEASGLQMQAGVSGTQQVSVAPPMTPTPSAAYPSAPPPSVAG